ncbi:hypothetical protein AUP40_06730 [Thalassospira xiamenensis]|uniref:Uncharacterized protein n=1 Tax=Thalassospira xiamenensis TaxID=220697 RepID=A0ABR5XWG0_9PROT|nr:hypothetical protein AUP40_06730 [Thalassospira xiamenensis]HBN52018.1 hypothetical protein [Thalassospira sp.]
MATIVKCLVVLQAKKESPKTSVPTTGCNPAKRIGEFTRLLTVGIGNGRCKEAGSHFWVQQEKATNVD